MSFAAKVVEVQTMLLSPRSGGLTLARLLRALTYLTQQISKALSLWERVG
jgi:hypothetical protein